MISVFWAELHGDPVETNIVDTTKEKRKKELIKNWLRIVHHSHQYVAVCLNKKSGSLAMTKGQLISERHLGVFKSPKKQTFFAMIFTLASKIGQI